MALREFNGPGRENDIRSRYRRGVPRPDRERARRAVLSRDKARREEVGQAREGLPEQREGQRRHLQPGQGASPSISTRRGLPAALAGRHPSDRDVAPLMNTTPSRSRSSRWTAAAATSWCRAARCSRRPAPSSARSWCRNLEEGQVIDGVVKNITDTVRFVDLGGIDGPAARHRHRLAPRQPPDRGADHRPDVRRSRSSRSTTRPPHLART